MMQMGGPRKVFQAHAGGMIPGTRSGHYGGQSFGRVPSYDIGGFIGKAASVVKSVVTDPIGAARAAVGAAVDKLRSVLGGAVAGIIDRVVSGITNHGGPGIIGDLFRAVGSRISEAAHRWLEGQQNTVNQYAAQANQTISAAAVVRDNAAAQFYAAVSLQQRQRAAAAYAPFTGSSANIKMDSGGWLMPGQTTIQNNTGAPEPVLTGAQWKMLTSSRSAGVNISEGAIQVNVTIEGHADSPAVRAAIDQATSGMIDDLTEYLRRRR
jgi:hypothetical protein